MMMSMWHLLWIVPLAQITGFVAAALLSAGSAGDREE